MAEPYRDAWITCTGDRIRIRGYYFPWGTKTVRYTDISRVRRVAMGPLTGRFRLWGSAGPRLWASLDPHRTRKREGLVLDLGRAVRPLITPDDVPAVVAVLAAHGVPGADPDAGPGKGVLV
jgi:hypothetical protein